MHTISQKKKVPFPAMTVVFCGICTLLFMSMVFNFVRINECTKDISAMQSEVEQLSNQKNQLQTELNNKNSVDKLRQYLESTGNLGMVDEGKMNAPIAVTPRKEDQVEDYDAPERERNRGFGGAERLGQELYRCLGSLYGRIVGFIPNK